MGVVDDLVSGREAYDRRDWVTAYDRYRRRPDTRPGRLRSARHGRLSARPKRRLRPGAAACVPGACRRGDVLGAVRCAFWLALMLITGGERGRQRLGRARPAAARRAGRRRRARLPADPRDVYRHIVPGESRRALRVAAEIEQYGRRFGDPDWSPWAYRRRAGCCSTAVACPRASHCSTRPWSASPLARCRRLRRATSTAR